MNCPKIQRGGGAIRQQPIDQRLIHGLRISGIRVARLEREGVGLQPLLERQVERLAELRALGRMYVEVDETGQEILVGTERNQIVPGGETARLRLRLGRFAPVNRFDTPVAADNDERVA